MLLMVVWCEVVGTLEKSYIFFWYSRRIVFYVPKWSVMTWQWITMQFYKERILNAAQLKRLSEHKYSCTSASILDAWLQPWWCWLVSKTPLWLAPNLITILGLIVNIVTTLILVWWVKCNCSFHVSCFATFSKLLLNADVEYILMK